eukprot:TRINITY_DN5105_c0_g2_i5.p1 TRINITY_DN5105_c0_g2~~TRINITY_DN5105_c0_g2_i5.p1  ORF type:complete len:611 (-),score=192.66 TRINITY_DN5105_c0_g2_i5:7-1749(-)
MDPCNPLREAEKGLLKLIVLQPPLVPENAMQQATIKLKLNMPHLARWRKAGEEIEARMLNLDNCEPEQAWPRALSVWVNGSNAFNIEPPKEGHKRRDVPQRISASLKSGINELKVFIKDGFTIQRYALALVRVKPQTQRQLFQSVKFVSEEEGKSLVTNLLFNSTLESTGEEVHAEGSDRCRLVCPVTLQRLETPVRGQKCRHLQCFDLKAYLISNMRMAAFNKRWFCPVCAIVLRPPADLLIDMHMLQILAKTEADDEEIGFDQMGEWQVTAKAAAPLSPDSDEAAVQEAEERAASEKAAEEKAEQDKAAAEAAEDELAEKESLDGDDDEERLDGACASPGPCASPDDCLDIEGSPDTVQVPPSTPAALASPDKEDAGADGSSQVADAEAATPAATSASPENGQAAKEPSAGTQQSVAEASPSSTDEAPASETGKAAGADSGVSAKAKALLLSAEKVEELKKKLQAVQVGLKKRAETVGKRGGKAVPQWKLEMEAKDEVEPEPDEEEQQIAATTDPYFWHSDDEGEMPEEEWADQQAAAAGAAEDDRTAGRRRERREGRRRRRSENDSRSQDRRKRRKR